MAYTTIDDPSVYFNTVLWSGNSSTQSITGVGFQPDFVWLKSRTNSASHRLNDSNRGVNKQLASDSADDESSFTTMLTSFDSDGFTLGNNVGINGTGYTNVGWNWKANGGTTSSNSDGSITSTVQANTTAGFSIVTFTGNATAGQTVGHGLGVKPEFIFAKNRSNGNNWNCYVEATDNTGDYTLTLNGTGGRSNSFNMWNDTAPTSSVITLGNRNETNGSSHNMIYYVFHSIKGYSKFGSYTGNGAQDGTFVYTGFKPAFILAKRTDASGKNWYIADSTRSPSNITKAFLSPNLNSAEDTSGDATDAYFDILSNGFKLRQDFSHLNASGSTQIYMAFAEHPFVSSKGVPVTAR
jgi:hypothetical protein